MSDTLLSILVPVYNERYTVRDVLDAVLAAPLPDGVRRELVVIDDHSTDGTDAVLRDIAAAHPEVSLHRHDVNMGKGAAIHTAVGHATGDIAIIQDADLEYDPNEIADVIEPILTGSADAVFGSRFLPRSHKRVLLFWHSLGNRFLTTLSNMFTNLDLTDMETCYKAIRLPLLKSIPIRSKRFGIEPELTSKLAKRGARIYEVPISYRGRTYREGKKITWRDGVKAIATILLYAVVDDIYDAQYGHDILHRLSHTHRFNRWMADTIRPHLGDRVLEIGAGLGNLTHELLPREEYCASDIDPLHLTYLESLFDQRPRVSVRTLDVAEPRDAAAVAGRFDTVVALNVIEHVEDDAQAFRNLDTVLAPDGRAVVLVPRGRWLFGSFDTVLGHHRRYTATELRSKLTAAGFAVERVFTFNRVSVPGWLINGRILRRRKFGRMQLKLFDSTVWLWRRIDRLLPWRGLSLIAVARKPATAAAGAAADAGPAELTDAASAAASS